MHPVIELVFESFGDAETGIIEDEGIILGAKDCLQSIPAPRVALLWKPEDGDI